MDEPLLPIAQRWLECGFSVIRAHTDGTKRPLGEWKQYQEHLPTMGTLVSWFGGDYSGMGLVCGHVSGNMEMMELEGRAVADTIHLQFIARVATEDPSLLVVFRGYTEDSPALGLHLVYRVDGPVGGNTVLAQRLTADGPRPLIETRGEGGFVVVAPSWGTVHPTGRPWVVHSGSPETVPLITSEQRDLLHCLAREFDELPAPVLDHLPTMVDTTGEETPGQAFNAQASWSQILEPCGWTLVRTMGVKEFWRRPGKNIGVSAQADDYFYNYSSSVNLPQLGLSKWRLYTFLHCGGDFSRAASELRQMGYGGLNLSTEDGLPVLTPPDASLVAPTTPSFFDRMVDEELRKIKVRDKALRLFKQEKPLNDSAFDPVNLTALLDEPDEPEQYLVESLWPQGGRVMLAAQYKAGKTTLTGNLARCLVDGDKFLETYEINHKVHVAMIDTEMTRNMVRTWLREQGIKNTADIDIWPLRGQTATFNILDDEIRARWAECLRNKGIDLLIFDCLRPVLDALQLSEDKDGGRFLVNFDALLYEANISDALIIQHMGHGELRSRGDSRFRDWPDVEWKIIREDDESSTRFFSAYGRNVEAKESELFHNSANRHLSIVGGSREDGKKDDIVRVAMEVLGLHVDGLSQRNLTSKIRDVEPAFSKTMVEKVLKKMVTDSRFNISQGGAGKPSLYKLREYRDWTEAKDE